MSWTLCLSSSKTTVLRLSSARPYWVGATPCGPRSRSRTPIVISNSAIDLEIADWVVFRRPAALLMLPACTTAIRTWMSCSFILRPMRSLNCISAPIAILLYLYREIALLAHSGHLIFRGHERSGEIMASIRIGGAVAALAALTAAAAAQAPSQAPSLAGKNVQMIVGFGSGGSFDLWGRVVARHI